MYILCLSFDSKTYKTDGAGLLQIVEELAPVTYALVCALILVFDLNKVPIGVTKKVGHVIGVMVVFPPSWKMAAIVV